LDDHDIRLIAPSDGEFNQIISSLIAPGSVPAETQAMLPYSVVLHNNTDRSLVVYSTQYTFTDATGLVSVQPGSTYWNLSTYKDGDDVPARSYKVVSSIFRLGQPRGGPSAQRLQSETAQLLPIYQRQRAIEISLDAAVFGDGQVVGPDKWHAAEKARAYLDAERDLNNEVIARGKRGDSATVLTWLNSLMTSRDAVMSGISSSGDATAVYAAHYAYYRFSNAQRFVMIAKQWGADKIVPAASNRIQTKHYLTIHR
jgi:hypothetical protein